MGGFDDATIALIVSLVREHYMLWGTFPTVDQVKALLRPSGP